MEVLAAKPVLATQYLATNATNEVNSIYSDETKGKMFTFTHTVNGNTVTESRYIGDDMYTLIVQMILIQQLVKYGEY